jgi:mRNA interferase MazF
VRGEVYDLTPKNAKGHERRGARFAVVVQASDLAALSTWICCPTSGSADPASFRPVVDFGRGETCVLVDQIMALDPERLGLKVGFLGLAAMQDIDEAIRLVLDV